MEIFDYIVGAVAAERPVSYEKEALKAQAVACYSYMMWVKENSDNAEYDITSNPATHQGYLTEDEMKEKWGNKYESYKGKIEEAVTEVYGKYMTYEGEVILALELIKSLCVEMHGDKSNVVSIHRLNGKSTLVAIDVGFLHKFPQGIKDLTEKNWALKTCLHNGK